jgi:hypothetical protein
MTPLEKLIEIINNKRKESDIANTLLRFCQVEAEKLLEDEKKYLIPEGLTIKEGIHTLKLLSFKCPIEQRITAFIECCDDERMYDDDLDGYESGLFFLNKNNIDLVINKLNEIRVTFNRNVE